MRLQALKRGIDAGDVQPTLAWWHSVGAAAYTREAADAIGGGTRGHMRGSPPPG